MSDISGHAFYSGSAWHMSNIIVCTTTTRPSGSALAVGSAIFETDTTRLMVWDGSGWENKSGSVALTSTTHPATSGQGLQVYETDTGVNSLYTGSFWAYNLMQIAPTQTVSGATSVTFSTIHPVKRLLILWRGHLTTTGTADLEMQIDNDSTAHYTWAKITSRGAAASASDGAGATTFHKIGVLGGTTASYSGNGAVWFDGWNMSTTFATFTASSTTWDSATSYWNELYSGLYGVAGPHNTVKIFCSSAFNGEFSLYGAM
jgi:hypothetical protein